MSDLRRNIACWYNSIWRFNQYERNKWVATWAARIPAGSRVLDVGAGSAPYRSFFQHCEYKAHDFGQVPELKAHYTELDYISDIVDIPVPDGHFDVVICTEVLEHVPEPIKAIQEMSRILKPGGIHKKYTREKTTLADTTPRSPNQ